MIKRDDYLEKIISSSGLNVIKVITGVRRCGKSTLLRLFRHYLEEQGVRSKQIQHINFEDLDNENLTEYRALHSHLKNNLQSDFMNYIFLDEIQRVEGFEKVLDSLFLLENVDIYVTGSNAYMLSGELATYLSGRYIEIHMFPLSFKEYYGHFGGEKLAMFNKYSAFGGFPYASIIESETSYLSYIQGIINTVLVKDVLSRKQRSDSQLVERLAAFLTDTSGSLINIKKIADTLTSMGKKTSSDTVSSYLQSFEEAFLFYKCDRFDMAGKRLLTINSKYYPCDQSLRRGLLGSKRPNFGRSLEGIVFLELIRRGYEVYVGNYGEIEIDFIAVKNGVTEYYQVSKTLTDEVTYSREIAGFKKLKDNYRKILLSEDYGNYNDEGIEQINVIDWLLE